jgi:hypothetical protein
MLDTRVLQAGDIHYAGAPAPEIAVEVIVRYASQLDALNNIGSSEYRSLKILL